MTTTIKVPDLGGAESVSVIELYVAEGDQVEADQALIAVESDKAAIDIPASGAGKVVKLLVAAGDEVSEGDAIAEIEDGGADAESSDSGDKVKTGSDAAAGDGESESPSAVQEEGSDKDAADKPYDEDESEQDKDEQQADKSKSKEDPESFKENSSSAATTEIRVPDLSGAESVNVVEVSVKAGDQVSEGDVLLVMESDKAAIDLPAPSSGTIAKVLISTGDDVTEGQVLFELNGADSESDSESTQSDADQGEPAKSDASEPKKDKSESTSQSTDPEPKKVTKSEHSSTDASPESKSSTNQESVKSEAKSTADSDTSAAQVYAGPAARKLARELGVTLSTVAASGPKNRVLKSDIRDHVKDAVAQKDKGTLSSGSGVQSSASTQKDTDFSEFGEIDIQKASKLKQLTAANMHRNWTQIPHVTQFDEADITELMDFRESLKGEMKRREVKLSPLPFIIKAVSAVLKSNPAFNASMSSDGQSIIYKKYVHIGVAVDTEHGLFVAVIRDVDQKGVWEIGAELDELAALAQNRKLTPSQMKGGCFTVSSLGPIGGQGFTPIVNGPEVGILGVSNMAIKPVYIDGQLEPRKLLPLGLSYDHRAVNGADAGRFLTDLVGLLSDIRRLLL